MPAALKSIRSAMSQAMAGCASNATRRSTGRACPTYVVGILARVGSIVNLPSARRRYIDIWRIGVPTSDIEECYSGNAHVRVGHGDVRGLQSAHGFCLSRPCVSQLLRSNAGRPECAKADCSFTSALTARACATNHASVRWLPFDAIRLDRIRKTSIAGREPSCLPASF